MSECYPIDNEGKSKSLYATASVTKIAQSRTLDGQSPTCIIVLGCAQNLIFTS